MLPGLTDSDENKRMGSMEILEKAMTVMCSTITMQMEQQSRLIDTLSSTMALQAKRDLERDREISLMQQSNAEFLHTIMDRMDDSDRRNHDHVMKLTQSVNDALMYKSLPGVEARCVIQ